MKRSAVAKRTNIWSRDQDNLGHWRRWSCSCVVELGLGTREERDEKRMARLACQNINNLDGKGQGVNDMLPTPKSKGNHIRRRAAIKRDVSNARLLNMLAVNVREKRQKQTQSHKCNESIKTEKYQNRVRRVLIWGVSGVSCKLTEPAPDNLSALLRRGSSIIKENS